MFWLLKDSKDQKGSEDSKKTIATKHWKGPKDSKDLNVHNAKDLED